jgi:hypothetical protein
MTKSGDGRHLEGISQERSLLVETKYSEYIFVNLIN